MLKRGTKLLWVISMRLLSKIESIIHNICPVAFGILFFTLPTCSLKASMTWVTWIATIVTMILFLIDILFNKSIKINAISISMLAFFVAYFVSLAVNKMRGFFLTALLLQTATLFFYTYLISVSVNLKKIFFWIFIGTLAFLFVFIISNFKELISLNFYRIGSKFGDVNDISMYLGFGFLLSLYFLLFEIKRRWKYILIPAALLFLLAGFSTGSKIFILIVVATSLFSIFLFFGKKRIWISVIIVACVMVLSIVILQLPFFDTIRTRLLNMLSLFGIQTDTTNQFDYSSYFRYLSFFDGIKMFSRKPFFGYGPEGFWLYGGTRYAWTHNHISESLCNYGLFGFLTFNFLYFCSIYSAIFRFDKKRILGYLMLIFFLITMISVAYYTEKLHAYMIPLVPFICCPNLKNKTISFDRRKNNEIVKSN